MLTKDGIDQTDDAYRPIENDEGLVADIANSEGIENPSTVSLVPSLVAGCITEASSSRNTNSCK